MAGIGHCLIRVKKNMHREIQIKQFPIDSTWWPKTRNERFCVRTTNSIYIVFSLLYTTMSKWLSAHTSGVWRVCARSDGGRVWSVVLHNFSSANGGISQSITSCKYPIRSCKHQKVWIVVELWRRSAPAFRHALRQALTRRADAHHTSHRWCAHSDHLDMVVYKR